MAHPSVSPPDRSAGGEEAYSPPETLTAPIGTGIKWKFTSQILREGTRLGVGILLARLLTPAEWGTATIAMALASFLTMLAEVGLPVALVQRARISEADRSTMFWTALGLGLAFTALGIALSGLVADLFDEPQLQWLFAALCLGFTVASLEKVPGALLSRDLAFRVLELRQIVATMSGAAVAVVLALAGTGSWAIIGNSLATTTVSCALLWTQTSWRPRLVFAWESFRSLTAFGGTLLGTQVLRYFQLYSDRLLIGRHLGPGPVGSYAFASQLMFTPIGNIAYPLQMVLFPAFATIQENVERLNAAWLRTTRISVALMTPAFLVLFVVGPDLIPTVFGSRWDDSIPVLQLLCLAGVAYALGTQNGILLAVKDRVGTSFRLALLITATVVAGMVVGLQWGITGVAAGFAIAHWLLVLPETWITARAAEIGFRKILAVILVPLPFAAVATAAALGARVGLEELGVSPWLRILVGAVVLMAVYVGLAYVGSKSLRADADEARSRLRSRRRAAAAGSPSDEAPTYR